MATITIVTCRKQKEPYDWLWWQQYYRNTQNIGDMEINHFIREGQWETNKINLQLAMILNEAYIEARGERDINSVAPENSYICKWTADVILADETLRNALYLLQKKNVVGAGLAGFIMGKTCSGTGYVRVKPGEACQGFLDWWIYKLKYWKHLPIPGKRLLESECEHQIDLTDEGKSIVHMTDPFLHFGKNVNIIREDEDMVSDRFVWDGKSWQIKIS